MIRTAKTENGMVKGLPAADPRITSFKGIPFAAPPVGENRWRAPQPCQDWEGVKECFEFAPISMQDTPALGTDIYCREWHVDPDVAMGEDCLYLNVWTNAKSVDDKKPVFVWFFGGGLQWGYPSEMEFDGERIARRDVVVVTVNYRINIFGFMAHPELTKNQPEGPTNFGNLDQQAGIKWVKRNIAAFGGDPDNITIAGQSAGGGSVLTQLGCLENEGLFQKAIIMSAMIRSPYQDSFITAPRNLAEAEKNGEDFFAFVGAKSLAEAREMDPYYLREKYAKFRESHPWFMTVQDGVICKDDPIKMIAENRHLQVPIMSGNTLDEFPNSIAVKDEEALLERAKELFKEKADYFMSFEEAKAKLDDDHYAPVSGIECSVKGTFLASEASGNKLKNFYYCFDADIPGWDQPGTFHSVDLWFFFETLAKCWRPFKGDNYDLARLMCNYMTNFVKTGDPNGEDADGTKMPQWNPYTKADPCSMIFKSAGVEVTSTMENDFKKFMIDETLKGILS